MPQRYDLGTLEAPKRLDDGRLVVDAKLTRTGVFPYLRPDGTTRYEYRPEQEVFSDDSLATFPHVSVTNDHPGEPVTIQNAKRFTVGMVGGNVRKMDGHVAAQLIVFDEKAIADIEGGKLEISCGYRADVETISGTSPTGEHYDAIQSNIRINHVAIVDRGRAGPEARIRLDASVQIADTEVRKTPTKGPEMDKLDKALLDVAQARVELTQALTRADKAESALADMQGKLDTETARADAADAEKKDSAEGFNAKVSARVFLLKQAATLAPEAKLDGSDVEVMREALKADGKEVDADKSDAYVQAAFDIATKNISEKAHKDALGAVNGGKDKVSNGLDKVEQARADMLERQANAWKGKA